MRIKVIVPFPLDEEAIARRAAQLSPTMLGPDVTVDYVPVRNSGVLADSAYDNLLIELFVVEAGIGAEADGYDAVCVDTASDSGVAALRSRLSIPVIGPGQVAAHTASLLGRRFSIVSTFERWADNCRKNLVTYEMSHKVASIRSLSSETPDVSRLLTDKPEVIDALAALAHSAVVDDGADAIVLASTTMHQAASTLADRLPVPVIDPGPWSVRLAADLVLLGVSHSRPAHPAPARHQDELLFALPSVPGFEPAAVAVHGSAAHPRGSLGDGEAPDR
ncbi:aspartate/glutamate racemase family protein [Rhodococcus sp. NPDC003322]